MIGGLEVIDLKLPLDNSIGHCLCFLEYDQSASLHKWIWRAQEKLAGRRKCSTKNCDAFGNWFFNAMYDWFKNKFISIIDIVNDSSKWCYNARDYGELFETSVGKHDLLLWSSNTIADCNWCLKNVALEKHVKFFSPKQIFWAKAEAFVSCL